MSDTQCPKTRLMRCARCGDRVRVAENRDRSVLCAACWGSFAAVYALFPEKRVKAVRESMIKEAEKSQKRS